MSLAGETRTLMTTRAEAPEDGTDALRGHEQAGSAAPPFRISTAYRMNRTRKTPSPIDERNK